MGIEDEMRPAIVSGIVTGDEPISYWPFFPLPCNSPRIHCESYLDPVSLSFLKWQMLLSPDGVFISMFKVSSTLKHPPRVDRR